MISKNFFAAQFEHAVHQAMRASRGVRAPARALESLGRPIGRHQSRSAPWVCSRCASTAVLRPDSRQWPLDRRWQQRRGAAAAAVAMYATCLRLYGEALTLHRLEEAHEPEELAQETIIENLDPREAARLSKVRNIGIAVCGLSPLFAHVRC